MNSEIGVCMLIAFLFLGCATLIFVLLYAEYKELKAKVNNQKINKKK